MSKLDCRIGDRQSDCYWDRFLENSPNGHFEQSSAWAEAKAVEGWKCERTEIFENDDRLAGGFQLFFRDNGLLRFGYITKGPVIESENLNIERFGVEQIIAASRRNNISALLVQPPDRANSLSYSMMRMGFLPNHLHSLIKATLLVDVSINHDTILKRMRRQTRQKIRQGTQRGVRIREGFEDDLPTFYQLMTASCRRQKSTRPSPRSLDSLRSIWSALLKSGYIRLTLAVVEGQPVSGLLCILFGGRVTFWKKGWDESHGSCHPNELLFYEALEWAKDQGFGLCDFGSLDFEIAAELLEGESLSSQQMKTRHFSHLGFGGFPIILPVPGVWIPNPTLRKIYKLYCHVRSPKQPPIRANHTAFQGR